jgi:hypothetical protein
MSSGESYDYPLCEEDDCYCKRHWPNRSGGDEHKVVNNDEEGEYTWRCDVAIDNGDYQKCMICEHFMTGEGLNLSKSDKICVRCCSDLWSQDFHDFLVDQTKKDPCILFKLFDFAFINPEQPQDEEGFFCVKCDKTHMTPDFEDNGFYYCPKPEDMVFLDGRQRCLSRLNDLLRQVKDKYNNPLHTFFFEDWVEFKQECRQKRREQKKEKKNQTKEKAKRMIRSFLPTATEDQAQKIVNKKQRFNESDIDKLQNEHDILKFIEWLKAE